MKTFEVPGFRVVFEYCETEQMAEVTHTPVGEISSALLYVEYEDCDGRPYWHARERWSDSGMGYGLSKEVVRMLHRALTEKWETS